MTKSRKISLRPQPWTIAIMEKLHDEGCIRLFKPLTEILESVKNKNVGANIYVSDEKYGPHKLIFAALNTDKVRLGVHPDCEEIFLPDLDGTRVKGCYYIVCFLREALAFIQRSIASR